MTKGQRILKVWVIGLIIMAIIAVVFYYIGTSMVSTSEDIEETVAEMPLLMLVCGVVEVVVFILLIKKLLNINNIFCPNCGMKYDYDDDVEYAARSYMSGNENGGGYAEKVLLGIRCCCRNCGNTKRFDKWFYTRKIGAGAYGANVEYDVEEEVRKYFE